MIGASRSSISTDGASRPSVANSCRDMLGGAAGAIGNRPGVGQERINAGDRRGHAQRAAVVAADRERHHPGGDCHGVAATAAAGAQAGIERIDGRAVARALSVCHRSARSGRLPRAIGTAPAARRCATCGASWVASGEVAAEAERRRCAADVDVLLDAEGHAGQRAVGELGLERARKGVEGRVELRDPLEVRLDRHGARLPANGSQ